MPWTAVAGAAVGGLVSSALSPTGIFSGNTGPNTSAAAGAADPFASQRGQYQQQLSAMMNPGGATTPAAAATGAPAGSAFTGAVGAGAFGGAVGGAAPTPTGTPATGGGFTPADPSYAWRFNQGLGAMQRTQAASGGTGSGAALIEAQTYGQGMASQEYANQFSRLSQLAGANVGSPAAAGQIIAGQQQQQQAGATAFGSTVGNAFGNYLNQPNPNAVVDPNAMAAQPSSVTPTNFAGASQPAWSASGSTSGGVAPVVQY